MRLPGILASMTFLAMAGSEYDRVERLEETSMPQSGLGGSYFGVKERDGWRLTHLLVLDADGSGGAIYGLGRLLRICPWQLEASDSISLITGEFLGGRHTLVGRRVGEHFRGRLTWYGRDFGQVSFFPISAVEGQEAAITGVYSTVRLVPEAGDVAGTEVVVARGRDEWRVMYDEHPGASMPFASKTASWRADTLWFDLLLPGGRTDTFFGVRQDNGLKIVKEKPSLYSEVLPKRFTIDEFFAQERHGECE